MLADHGVQLRAGLKPQWRSLRSPIEAGFSAPLRWDSVVCRQALARGHFRTPIPSLCHSAPGGLALWVACKFGHKLAFSCVLQKFLRRMHRGHYAPWCPDPLSQSPYIGVTEKGKESSPNALKPCRGGPPVPPPGGLTRPCVASRRWPLAHSGVRPDGGQINAGR